MGQPSKASQASCSIKPNGVRTTLNCLMKSVYDIRGMQREAFLLTAEHAFDIATHGLYRLKRTTKNTLATIQKVGRTTKNRMSPNNHQYLKGYNGYETY